MYPKTPNRVHEPRAWLRYKTKTSTENPRPIKTQTTRCESKHWEYVQNASKITTNHHNNNAKQRKMSK